MKVHVQQIPPEGKRYDGEMPSDVLELNSDDARAVGPIAYGFDAGITDDGFWAHGQVAAEMEFRCVRCLEKFRRLVAVPDFALQVPLEGKETVDLTEPIREDILLALPAHPNCDWDGKKVCKTHFSNEAAEPIGDHEDIWKGLDKLKL